MGTPLSISERLGTTAFATDAQTHLRLVNNELCLSCAIKPCIRVCPAEVYRWDTQQAGKLLIRYENCLETGACRVACQAMGNRSLIWEFPPGGRGVTFRLG